MADQKNNEPNGTLIFAFDMGQRVMLANGVQGVVTGRRQFGWREPEYEVQALTTDRFSLDGMLLAAKGAPALSESALADLQPVRSALLANFTTPNEVRAGWSVTSEMTKSLDATRVRAHKAVRPAGRTNRRKSRRVPKRVLEGVLHRDPVFAKPAKSRRRARR